MSSNQVKAGFLGAGGIARAHAFAISALKFYYEDAPGIRLVTVTSKSQASMGSFAAKYGFEKALAEDDFFSSSDIDTVFILGPNNVHHRHLKAALSMPSVKCIYIEKPVCSSGKEEEEIAGIASQCRHIKFQTGFQYLFSPAVRESLRLWQSGIFGRPLHFEFRYYHGDYLLKSYRDKRLSRLTPAPDGGAMADLGSHAISMLAAFLGEELEVVSAIQSGSFPDVNPSSDLFSQSQIRDRKSGAAGSLSASRIASGTGDLLAFEIYAENGAIRYSSHTADFFEYCVGDSGTWTRKITGSSYLPVSGFPSVHVPPGWLRPMIHAHYVFLKGSSDEPFIPDLNHGLCVQRIIRETAAAMLKNNR